MTSSSRLSGQGKNLCTVGLAVILGKPFDLSLVPLLNVMVRQPDLVS
jgi:hypothetical protein